MMNQNIHHAKIYYISWSIDQPISAHGMQFEEGLTILESIIGIYLLIILFLYIQSFIFYNTNV